MLIKSKLFSLVQYIAFLHDIPPSVLKQIEDVAWNFLWKNKSGSAVARAKAQKSVKAGGLNYPNLARSIKVRRAGLVKQLIDPNYEAFWAKMYRSGEGELLGNGEFHINTILVKSSLRRFKKTIDPYWTHNFQA